MPYNFVKKAYKSAILGVIFSLLFISSFSVFAETDEGLVQGQEKNKLEVEKDDLSPSFSPSPEPSASPSPSVSNSPSPTPTVTPTASFLPTPSPSISPSSNGREGGSRSHRSSSRLNISPDKEDKEDKEEEKSTNDDDTYLAQNQATSSSIFIYLTVSSATTTLFKSEINVSECSPGGQIASSTSGYCALSQAISNTEWSSFGDDYFLNSIEGITNDFGKGLSWGWFSDLEYGNTSLNKHLLYPGEHLLVTIGRMPLKLLLSTTTPIINSTTTATVYEFGFDSSWNAIWSPSASSSIKIGNSYFESDGNGRYDILATSTSPFSVYAAKAGFIDSEEVTISPIENEINTENSTGTTSDDTNDTSQGGGVTVHHTINIDEAIRFLSDHQNGNGSFSGGGIYTDWAAIAFAAHGDNSGKEKIKKYIRDESGDLSDVIDYIRHSMALMALGINPYNGTSVNYIEKITDSFDGTQIGDKTIFNDDIFSLFPLVKVGYDEDDEVIEKITAFIVSKQNSDGSWVRSIDVTSAAVQALSLVSSISGVDSALKKARQYLSSEQQGNGGFGNSFSTSWAIQAIYALNEDPSQWVKNGNNPNDFIYSLVQDDGGIKDSSSEIDMRVWATSYVIPAHVGKPWGDILLSFDRPSPPENLEIYSEQEDRSPGSEPATVVLDIQENSSIIESPPIVKNDPPVSLKHELTDDDYLDGNGLVKSYGNLKKIDEKKGQVLKEEENTNIINLQDEVNDKDSALLASAETASKGIPKSIMAVLAGMAGAIGIFFITKRSRVSRSA